MQKIGILLFLIFGLLVAENTLPLTKNKIEDNATNQDTLFSIGDNNYTKKDFPDTFQSLSTKEQKDFVSRYIYYKLFLDKLTIEQKKYQIQIKKALNQKEIELNRKGIVFNKLQKIIFNKKIILNTIAYHKILSKHKDIDSKVKEFYTKHKDGYKFPKRVEVSHIVIKDKKDAENILEKLKNKPHDIKLFAALAKEKTLDKTTKYSGGYVGSVGEKEMGKEFFESLWNTKENSIVSKPLKKNKYYHLVYVFEKYKAEQRTLEEERVNIKDSILKKDINEWKQTNFRKIKEKSVVKFYSIKL